MLAGLRLGNFKAFADTQHIPIRPLTLIFGANSSGKSSIIHSLLFAKQALDKDDMDVHRTEVGGDSVDLGGFWQYIHRRTTDHMEIISRLVEWGLEIDVSDVEGRLAELLFPVKRIAVSVKLGIKFHPEMRDDIHKLTDNDWARLGSYIDEEGLIMRGVQPEIHYYEMKADDIVLLKMSHPGGHFLGETVPLNLEFLNHEHPAFRNIFKAILETSTTTESIRAEDFNAIVDAVTLLAASINITDKKILPDGLLNPDKTISENAPDFIFPLSQSKRKDDIVTALRFFFPRIINELISGTTTLVSRELARLLYLGPLRSYPQRHLISIQPHDSNWYAGGGHAWDIVRRDDTIRAKVNNWLSSQDRLQTPYKLIVRELVGLDQIENPLRIGLLKMYEAGELFDDPEADAKRLHKEIDYSTIDRLRELTLIDQRSNTQVSHRDIGIGISQVLPVLVYSYAYTNRIITIEQPEIHLHPALQADIADVFIESALGERKNTFIVETHSEHLILRILRRIRETSEGTLKEGLIPITPADVQVIYAKATSNGTMLHHLPITEDGEFAEKWPDGFFPERAKELF